MCRNVAEVTVTARILTQFPPRTRGCTTLRGYTSSMDEVSPAHAGMHPTLASTNAPRSGFPRARGDAPLGCPRSSKGLVFPPRTRGCTQRDELAKRIESVSPAHAGMHRST